MPTPILATKLYIPPPRAKAVLRPRLIERLNEGLHRKLMLISAPAGFGKTTLVSEWVAGCGRPAAWLSLDEGDSDPTRFLAYLVAALQTISPNIGKGVLGALQSPQPPSTESILTILVNEITTIPVNFVLVLDDYHVIDAKPVDTALSFLLEHLPPQMHLVITTRESPQLPLSRLRVRDQLTELRAADLRFTPDEAAEFLNNVMGLNLSPEDIAALETRTEGWIAGLQLAALSMQGQEDATGFIKSFTGSHYFVMDYLVEQVLQLQSASVQSFLLRTSILDRLCGPLCDAVLLAPVGSGQETLEYIERANLLIVPLDNERRWYRYHALFADLLRQRLRGNAPSTSDVGSSVDQLHIRASRWYEHNGSPADAIHHALVAEDFERAARLIELAWPAMDANFRSAAWLGWVSALPDEVVRARPVLCVAYAWALLNAGKMEAGEARLRDAEQWLDPAADTGDRSKAKLIGMVIADQAQFQFLSASIASARAYISQALGDVPGGAKYARQALDLLPAGDHLRRGQAAALLGLAHWANGDLEESHQALSEAMANFQAAGKIVFAISATYGLADIRIAQGRLSDAIHTYEKSLQLVAEQGELALPGTAELYLGLSELYREQDDLPAAAQHLLKSGELGEPAGLPDWPNRYSREQARMKETQGDLKGALEMLDEAQRQYFRGAIADVRPLAAFKTRVWVRQGNLAEALRWARERGLSVDDKLSYLQEFEHVTLARVLIAGYKRNREESSIQEAIGFLRRLLQAAEEGGRMGSAIEILMLEALAYKAQGDIPSALVALERALTLAEPEGYVRTFVDEGEPMRLLISDFRLKIEKQVRNVNDEKALRLFDYSNKLLGAFEILPARAAKSEIINHKSRIPIEPLSQRELEVLRLIAQGLSNREIGERLVLALDTVKGHNRKIFGKLQVTSRFEALARARELGLL